MPDTLLHQPLLDHGFSWQYLHFVTTLTLVKLRSRDLQHIEFRNTCTRHYDASYSFKVCIFLLCYFHILHSQRLCYSVASVVCLECIVAKRCVLEQKLLLTAYRKSYIRNRLVPKWMTSTFV